MTEEFEIREMTTSAQDLAHIFPILHQLREHLKFDDFARRYVAMYEDASYRVLGLFVGDEVRAVAGFRFILNMSVGNSLYIDDFVVGEQWRSKGYGQAIVRYLEKIAEDVGADAIRLDSAVHRLDAHRFYEREGFYFYSKHFVKEL